MEYKITTYSEEETIELAQNIESEKFPNMVICLRGDLGSGKTVFTKGFAQAMEINEEVTSPTFNIIKEYTTGEMPLFHMDVYRLDGKVDELGIEEYFTKKGVTIIEWADMIPDVLPDRRLDIKIRSSEEDEDKRIYMDMKIANSWWMYLLGVIVVIVVLIGSFFFIYKSYKDAKELNMDMSIVKKAIFNSAVFTILPRLHNIYKYVSTRK